MTMRTVDVNEISNKTVTSIVDNLTKDFSSLVSVPSLKTIAKSKLLTDTNNNESDLNKKLLPINSCHSNSSYDRITDSFDVPPKVKSAEILLQDTDTTYTPSNTSKSDFFKTHNKLFEGISITNAPSTPENPSIGNNISTSNSISSPVLHALKINPSNSIIKSLRSRNLKRINSFDYKSSPTKARLHRQWKQQKNLMMKQQKINEREKKQLLKLQKIKEKEEKKLIREQKKIDKLALKQIKLEKSIKNTTNVKNITTKKIRTPDKAQTKKVKVYNVKRLKEQPANNKVSVIKFCPKPLHRGHEEQQSNCLVETKTQLKPITNIQLTSVGDTANNTYTINTITHQVKPIFNIKKPTNALKESKSSDVRKNLNPKVIPIFVSTTLTNKLTSSLPTLSSSILKPPNQPTLVAPINTTSINPPILNQSLNLPLSSNSSKHIKIIKRKIFNDSISKDTNKKANLSTDPSVIPPSNPSPTTSTTTSLFFIIPSDTQDYKHQENDEKIESNNLNTLPKTPINIANDEENVTLQEKNVKQCDIFMNDIILPNESIDDITTSNYMIFNKDTGHNDSVVENNSTNDNVIDNSHGNDIMFHDNKNDNDDNHNSTNSIIPTTNDNKIDTSNNNASNKITHTNHNTNIKPLVTILKTQRDVLRDKKKVKFQNVEVYYFHRIQGFSCIPSQGGITIGMSDKHCGKEEFPISAYTSYQRQHKQQQLLLLQQPIFFNQHQQQQKNKMLMKGQDWQQKQPQQYLLPQHFSQHCFFNNSQNFLPFFSQSTFTPSSFSSSSPAFPSSTNSFVNMPLLTNTYSFPFTSRPYNHFNNHNYSIISTSSNHSVVTSATSLQLSSQNSVNFSSNTLNLVPTTSSNTTVVPTIKPENITTSAAEEINNAAVDIPKNIASSINETSTSSQPSTTSLNITANASITHPCKSAFPAPHYTTLKDFFKVEKQLDTQFPPPSEILTIKPSQNQSTLITTISQPTMIQLPSQTNVHKDNQNISPLSSNNILPTSKSNTQTINSFSTICSSDFHITNNNVNQITDQTVEGIPNLSTPYFVNNDNVNTLNNNQPIKRLSLWRIVKDKSRDNKATQIMTPPLSKRSRRHNNGNKKENDHVPTTIQTIPCLNTVSSNINVFNNIKPANNINTVVSTSSDKVKLNNMIQQVTTSNDTKKYNEPIYHPPQYTTTITTTTFNDIIDISTSSSISANSLCADSSSLSITYVTSSYHNNNVNDNRNNNNDNMNNTVYNDNNEGDNNSYFFNTSNGLTSSKADTTPNHTTINSQNIYRNDHIIDMKSDKNTEEVNELNTPNTGIITNQTTRSSSNIVTTTFNNYYYEEDDDDDDYEIYSLQPLPVKQRRNLLKLAGLKKINNDEREECKRIRISREECGCACKTTCVPETCLCIQNGIMCQVDRMSFPCGCSLEGCTNPEGRVEFNAGRVKMHLVSTLVQLQAQKAKEDANNTYPSFDTSSQRSFPPFIPSYSHSPTYYQYPQQYAFDGFVAKYMSVGLKSGEQTGYHASSGVMSSSYSFVGGGDYSKELVRNESVSKSICASGSFYSVDSCAVSKDSTNHCKLSECYNEGYNKTEKLNQNNATDVVNTISSNNETFCNYKPLVNQNLFFKSSCQYTNNTSKVSCSKASNFNSAASGSLSVDSCHKTINSQPCVKATNTLSTCKVTKDENMNSDQLIVDNKFTDINVKDELNIKDKTFETDEANKYTKITNSMNTVKIENLETNIKHVDQNVDKETTTKSSDDHTSFLVSMHTPHKTEATKDVMLGNGGNVLYYSELQEKERDTCSDVLGGAAEDPSTLETAIPGKSSQSSSLQQ